MLRKNKKTAVCGALAVAAALVPSNILSLMCELFYEHLSPGLNLSLSLATFALLLLASFAALACFPYYLRVSRGVPTDLGDYLCAFTESLGRYVLLSLACALKIFLALLLPLAGFLVSFSLVTYFPVSVIPASLIVIPKLVALILLCSLIFCAIRSMLGYALVFFVSADEPDMPIFTVLRTSRSLMENNKARLLLLLLSFVGWELLSTLTLGLGGILQLPYLYCSLAFFYRDLTGDTVNP